MPSICTKKTTKLNLKTEEIIGTGIMMGISFSVVIGVLIENFGSQGDECEGMKE